MIDTRDVHRYYGCIKCGLKTEVLEYSSHNIGFLPTDEKIMYDYLRNHKGINIIGSDILCDLSLVRAIYLKIKEKHPNIDDKTTLKYFEIALDDIRNMKLTEDKKSSIVKSLSLPSGFNSWYGIDVHH